MHEPVLLILPAHVLESHGFEELKASVDRLGLDGFEVVGTWGEPPLARYVRFAENKKEET